MEVAFLPSVILGSDALKGSEGKGGDGRGKWGNVEEKGKMQKGGR